MRYFRILVLLAVGVVAVLALSAGAFADGGGRPLATTLTGAEEVPGPGDSDGSGTASFRLNPGTKEICFELSASNITLPAAAAHIHIGPAGVAGPVVVGLTPPGADGTSSGCVQASSELIMAIMKNPENYYVNVHTVPSFPAGAIRGQLSK